MEKIVEYNVKIPDYALPYLINADSSGLNKEDIKNIDNYMQEFYNEADNYEGQVLIDLTNVDSEGYFTWNPAFGLACNVYDCTILILK